MAIEARDIAILSARFGVARFGASRFGFCPDYDVEGTGHDEPGEYIWKEQKPDRTDWVLQNPCLICGALCVASFTASPTSGLEPLEVTFTDTSTGGVTFWYWTFGDGEHSYEQNPVHTYESAGSYTVNLSVSGPGGSDGPASDTITVTALGSIFGIVTNEAAPYEGATITLVETSATTLSAADGSYSFADLEPGDYNVSATAPGGLSGSNSGTVLSGQALELNINLTGA